MKALADTASEAGRSECWTDLAGCSGALAERCQRRRRCRAGQSFVLRRAIVALLTSRESVGVGFGASLGKQWRMDALAISDTAPRSCTVSCEDG
jgi:hypothetical protein